MKAFGNGKREPARPTRGTMGGFVDWWDSEQIEAARQIAANAERVSRELDPELIERIGREWRGEIAAEQKRSGVDGIRLEQMAA